MNPAVQSMSHICARVSAALIALGAMGVSKKVMSEISQISKSVIRMVISISTIRIQRKVRSEKYESQKSQNLKGFRMRARKSIREWRTQRSMRSSQLTITCLSKVILHRVLSMTEGESHARVHSLTDKMRAVQSQRQQRGSFATARGKKKTLRKKNLRPGVTGEPCIGSRGR
eukprot:5054232-Amphidinium_carterae.2